MEDAMRGMVIVAGIVALAVPGIAAAQECKVSIAPATGQTLSYTADRNGVPAATVPDDGAIEAGAPMRYKDNGDGTVIDKDTGLLWEKKIPATDARCLPKQQSNRDPHCVNNLYAWSNVDFDTIWDFVEAVNDAGYAGYTDWRVPNVRELLSIADYSGIRPAINPILGPTRDTAGYWTSTTVQANSSLAWVVVFIQGGVARGHKEAPNVDSVRLVRGGCL
jgi:hypothetical protein